MNREEAIATLEAIKQFGMGKWIFDKEEIEAFDMAIEALSTEAEANGDIISRQDAIKAIDYRRKTANIDSRIVLDEVANMIRDLPSERAKGGDAEIPSLEQYPYMKQSPNSGADLISRVDVLALAEKGYIISNSNYKKVCELINELPSADTQTSVDLISRADAIRWVKTECNPYGKPTLDFESGKKVIEHLKQMPSADRPSGEWVESLERNDMMYWYSYGGICTNCGEYSEYLTRYCGDCGAVMYALNDRGEVIGGAKKESD